MRTQLHYLRYRGYSQHTGGGKVAAVGFNQFVPHWHYTSGEGPLTLDGHNKHKHLSYSQHKGVLRVLTATLFTMVKKSPRTKSGFQFYQRAQHMYLKIK